MKKFLLVFSGNAFGVISTLFGSVYASDMKLCKTVAERLEGTLPIKVDRFTKVTKIGCIPSSSKVALTYIHELSVSLEVAKSVDFTREIKPGSLKFFCSDPQGRAVVDKFDVNMRYYIPDGTYVGSFLISTKDCNRKN